MRALVLVALSSLALAACSSSSASTSGSAAESGKGAPGADSPAKSAAKVINLPALGLKGTAAGETEEPIIGSGDPILIAAAQFTVNVSAAKPTDPKTAKDALEVAKGFNGTDVKSETLPDGWIVTFKNTGSLGDNYWVSIRREIGGKGYMCETTQTTPAQQKASIDFCKSLTKG